MTAQIQASEGMVYAAFPWGVAKGSLSKTILTDGAQFYCKDGDFTADTFGSVLAHRSRTHGQRPGRKRADGKMTLADLQRRAEHLLADITRMADEGPGEKKHPGPQVDWKERALAAEKKLRDNQKHIQALLG